MKFPLEDNTEIPGCVKFTPCDLFGNPIGGTQIELYLPPSITFADGANYEKHPTPILAYYSNQLL